MNGWSDVLGMLIVAAGIIGVVTAIMLGISHASDNRVKQMQTCTAAGGDWTIVDRDSNGAKFGCLLSRSDG